MEQALQSPQEKTEEKKQPISERKWYGIVGSWQYDFSEIREDAQKHVRDILKDGNGIITGGALGVDYWATQTALDEGDPQSQIKLVLPVALQDFLAFYRLKKKEGRISDKQCIDITFQLKKARDLKVEIIDRTPYRIVGIKSYDARTKRVVEMSDGIYAFQVINKENPGGTRGTQFGIDYANSLNKPILFRGQYNGDEFKKSIECALED